jgi:3-hydroxyisobutyrate dehydrogenase-like beta-hydroxyacid dehydrogenase
MQTIAVIAPGAMGSAVAHRLSTKVGVSVLTSLTGRSAATIQRAEKAGMRDAGDGEIAEADVILSILPPGEAVALAERFVEPLARASHKAMFVDCNAVNVETVQRISSIIKPTGAAFVDGAIIGPPPSAESNPTFYFSGEEASLLSALGGFGLKVQVIDANIGAASALKMAYAGINKGITLLVAAMILNSIEAGAGKALHFELAASQSELLRRVTRSIPDMYPKAYRWAPEMEEIAAFVAGDPPTSRIFEALGQFCRRMAADAAGERANIECLDAFLQG